MAADATVVQQRVTEAINAVAPGTFSTTVSANYLDRNATAIAEAVREAALQIAWAIVANPNHVHRGVFVSGTPTALTHGGEMPDMAGESDLVEIQPYSAASYITGSPRTAQQIDDYRTNYNSSYGAIGHTTAGSPLTGFYNVSNGRIKFTGNAAQVYIPVISRTGVLTLIPDEYEGIWFAASMGLVLKEGDNLAPIGMFYQQIAAAALPTITSMGTVQPIPPIEKAIQARGDS